MFECGYYTGMSAWEKDSLDAFYDHCDIVEAASASHGTFSLEGVSLGKPYLLVGHPDARTCDDCWEIIERATEFANEQDFGAVGIVVESDGAFFEYRLPRRFVVGAVAYPTDRLAGSLGVPFEDLAA